MKKLLDVLRSERSVVAGALGCLSDQFGWNRAMARIVGFFLLWGAPYLLGAPVRKAWWISILLYVGLVIIARKISCPSRDRVHDAASRRSERRFAVFTDQNNCRPESRAPTNTAPTERTREPMDSSFPSSPSAAGNEPNVGREKFGDVLSDLEQRLARLDQRIQKMESAVTDRSFDWDRRLRQP